MPNDSFAVDPLNRVKRVPSRGIYDVETVYSIVDSCWVCHVSFIEDQRPVTIPMFFSRLGNRVVLHGSSKSRLMTRLNSGEPVCLSFAIVDGLILARSLFHHSMNYRSVVVFGCGTPIEGEQEKMDALKSLTDKIAVGRWDDARKPNSKELKATSIVAVSIDSASAKVRNEGTNDDPEDMSLPVWAGEIRFETVAIAKPDEHNPGDIGQPEYLSKFFSK